jgi:transcriptional regulator with XRE-family HTH domain
MNRKELDPTSSPKAAFGVQLRRSREARGVTQRALGRMINYSGTYVSYIEHAEREPTLKFAVLCGEALETGGTLQLMWWNLKHTALIEGFPKYAAQEAKAAEIRTFEPALVPGLFQIPEYATALAAAAVKRGAITQAQADERVAFVATRQSLLVRSPAPLVHAVLDESCLRRLIGGRDVMDRQLQHLENLLEQPRVIIQVAPFDLGERAPFTMFVRLLTLADRTVLAYSESQQRGFLEREPETVAAWERDYDWLQVEALPQADSLNMIKNARKGLCTT